MLITVNQVIQYPTLDFFDDQELEQEAKDEPKKAANRELSMTQPFKNRTMAQTLHD